MPKLNELPNEILHEIFSEDILSQRDLYSVLFVCKRVHEIGREHLPRTITLTVDAIHHPAYKFLRRLLVHPELGQKVHTLRQNFDRWDLRPSDEPDTKRWFWQTNEVCQIIKLGKEWRFSQDLVNTILSGMNSDAVFPLILCFLTNLKVLCLDGVRKWNAIDCGEDLIPEAEGVNVFRKRYTWKLDDPTDELRDLWLDRHLNTIVQKELGQPFRWRSPSNIKWPPGLLKLEKYSRFSREDIGISNAGVAPIFLLLPKLEELAWGRPYCRGSAREYSNKFPKSTLNSYLKRLEMLDGAFYTEDLLCLAEYTGALEYLKIGNYTSDSDLRVRKVGTEFMRVNVDTLKLENVRISDWNWRQRYGKWLCDDDNEGSHYDSADDYY